MQFNTIILFDLDGTLIDSTEAICESFYNAFKQNTDILPTKPQISKFIGYTLEDITKNILQENKHSYNDTLVSNIVKSYKTHYKAVCLQKTILLPNVIQALTLAKEFAKLGVVTTKTHLSSQILLEHLRVNSFFECIVGIEDVTQPKPNAEPIFKALKILNIQKDNLSNFKVAMIGDTPLDILAAQNAGVVGIAVTSGYASKDLLLKYTSNIVTDALEAVKLFKKTLTF